MEEEVRCHDEEVLASELCALLPDNQLESDGERSQERGTSEMKSSWLRQVWHVNLKLQGREPNLQVTHSAEALLIRSGAVVYDGRRRQAPKR